MNWFRYIIKKQFAWWLYRRKTRPLKRAQLAKHTALLQKQPPVLLADASYDVFTYHGEDGILHYLLSFLPDVPKRFVDVGSGDCIKSNCAMLAVHEGWQGVFIDMNPEQLAIGKNFYRHVVKKHQQLTFTRAEVTTVNINSLAGDGPVGVLSIDIDGNDYWIWKAIERISPEVVVVEAKVEFGNRNCVVPEGPQNHHSANPMYNGASVAAFTLLGKSKGYKLAGANKQGYNLFFVKEKHPLAGVTPDSVLTDPETKASFYPETFFTSHTFAQV